MSTAGVCGQRSSSAGSCVCVCDWAAEEISCDAASPSQTLSWEHVLMSVLLLRFGLMPIVEMRDLPTSWKKQFDMKHTHSCFDIISFRVCVCVGADTSSCRALEATGGAGDEGSGAGPPGERDAVAQSFRRSDASVQLQSSHNESQRRFILCLSPQET